MGDISCKMVRGYLEFLESRGVRSSEILARVSEENPRDPHLQTEFIENPRNHLPWNSYVTFLEYLKPYFPALEDQEALFAFVAKGGTKWMPMRKLAQLISSPRQFYFAYQRLIAPIAYGKTLQSSMEELSDGRLVCRLSLPDSAKSSLIFFEATIAGFVKLPMIIGLPDAQVEARYDDRSGEYYITLPRSQTLLARLIRRVRLLRFPQVALAELSAQEAQIREDYERLRESETKYRTLSDELEKRVHERTRELETSNRHLEERIAEITRQREENKLLQDRLVHVQKLEAVGTLAGGIAHEINNVLHGIFLSIDKTERGLEVDHPSATGIKMAKKFARRGQSLMKQVLAFSRKPQFEQRPVRLVPALAEAVQLMRSTLPKDIEILEDYSTVEPDQVWILGDTTQLQQVVVNLFSNATYAMKDQGTISLSVRRKNSSQVIIEVSDTGSGIPQEIRHRIFEPFFTTKPVGHGSGMGLSVVHGIIRAFNGEISVESQPGEGTQFRIELETCVSAAVEEDVSADEILASGGQERILVVDDEIEIVRLLAETLAVFGYQVESVNDGYDALKRVRSQDFDLVLTDLVMPRMTGVQLANEIRILHPEMPIILCTGYGEADIQEGDRSLFRAITNKPVDGFELNRSIRSVLDSRPPSRPAV